MTKLARNSGEVAGRSLWIRPTILALLVLASIAALLFSPLRDYLEPTKLYDALDRIGEHWAAPLMFLIGFICFSLVGSPMVPMVVAGAAVFGFGKGVPLNFAGVLLGASSSYWLARILGRDSFRRWLGSRYATLESLIRRRGFWTMVRLRFMPIPFPVANYGPALLGVGYPLFLASTALAYVPIVIVYSHFASTIVHVGESEREAMLQKLGLSIVLLLLLTFLPPWIVRLSQRRRSRDAGGQRAPGGVGNE